MSISAISSTSPDATIQTKRAWKTPLRDTGYAAAALAVGSAVAGSCKKLKLHKNLAYLSGLFTLWHIGIVEYYKHLKTK
ncbi:MAG: hypothetical protein KHX03_05200 [Clostridium sp.]|nr:hypothetical protein [Clostridium sp.]